MQGGVRAKCLRQATICPPSGGEDRRLNVLSCAKLRHSQEGFV